MFTDRELDVMAVLWDRGPSTVSEVRAELGETLAYTTVLTMLRILESKGHVAHQVEGKAHRYHAQVSRETAGDNALTRIVSRIFAGSREMLLAQLVSKGVDEPELQRLRSMLNARLSEGGDR